MELSNQMAKLNKKKDDKGIKTPVPEGRRNAAKPFKRGFSFLKPNVHKSSSSGSLNSFDKFTPFIYQKSVVELVKRLKEVRCLQ